MSMCHDHYYGLRRCAPPARIAFLGTPRHTRRETPSADTPHRAINSPPTKHTFFLSPHSYFFPHEWILLCMHTTIYIRWKWNISLNRWGLSFFSASLGRSSYCTCSVLLWQCMLRSSHISLALCLSSWAKLAIAVAWSLVFARARGSNLSGGVSICHVVKTTLRSAVTVPGRII